MLKNAIKYSESGTVVTLTIEEREAEYCCVVSDQGCGIPDSAISTLFDLYQRVSDPQRGDVKGTGLGLAFVKAVADRLGGTIEVSSELGVGTAMRLAIPRAN